MNKRDFDRKQHKPSDTDRILHELELVRGDVAWVRTDIADLARLLKPECHGGARSLGGFVAAVYGRKPKAMSNVTVPKLKDTEKVQLSVMPRKADGHVDIGASVSWASDSDQVGIAPGTDPFPFHDLRVDDAGNTLWEEDVTCPGAFNCFALTPLAVGVGTVTASASGYESEVFGPIEYDQGQPRKMNGSVGTPVEDAEITP